MSTEKKIGGSPKAAKPIPMGNQKKKVKNAPTQNRSDYKPGPKGGHAMEKGKTKGVPSHYPPASPKGGKPVVTRHGFLQNKSYYE